MNANCNEVAGSGESFVFAGSNSFKVQMSHDLYLRSTTTTVHNVLHSFPTAAKVNFCSLSRCQCATLIRIVVDWSWSNGRPHDRCCCCCLWTISKMIEEGPVAWSEAISLGSTKVGRERERDLAVHSQPSPVVATVTSVTMHLGNHFLTFAHYRSTSSHLSMQCHSLFGHCMRQLKREKRQCHCLLFPSSLSLRLFAASLPGHRSNSTAADHSVCQNGI